ncbi:hypothetical protein FACS1894122_11540 [Alphaproteobacteria bacterium]|nr:hypothetical protein FACS1894122_11540 [Alphaproteobacteria bacterium]
MQLKIHSRLVFEPSHMSLNLYTNDEAGSEAVSGSNVTLAASTKNSQKYTFY